jgi:hypothetical protein
MFRASPVKSESIHRRGLQATRSCVASTRALSVDLVNMLLASEILLARVVTARSRQMPVASVRSRRRASRIHTLFCTPVVYVIPSCIY